jgi:hypothetical protein
VEKLDYGSETNGAGAARARVTIAENQQGRPQAFAAAAQKIAGDFGDWFERSGALPR